jgi:hypothetical protein
LRRLILRPEGANFFSAIFHTSAGFGLTLSKPRRPVAKLFMQPAIENGLQRAILGDHLQPAIEVCLLLVGAGSRL